MKTSLAVLLLAAVASGSRLASAPARTRAGRLVPGGSHGRHGRHGRHGPADHGPAAPAVGLAADGREGVQVDDGFPGQREASPRRLPRMIWSAWLQGDPDCTAPHLNKMCLHLWGGMNGDTWNLTVLTHRTVFNVFPELRDIFEQEPKTLTAQSDLIRLHFLSKFGGVWVDASLLPVLRLDSFIDDYVDSSGFFSYRLIYDKNPEGKVSAWFMASYPGNALLEQWRANFLHRWQQKTEFSYFEVNGVLKDMLKDCKSNPDACAVWHSTPVKDSRPSFACLSGCSHFFPGTPARQWPAVLKRPYQRKGEVPEEWWDEYFAAVRLDRPKLLCSD